MIISLTLRFLFATSVQSHNQNVDICHRYYLCYHEQDVVLDCLNRVCDSFGLISDFLRFAKRASPFHSALASFLSPNALMLTHLSLYACCL